MIVEVLERLDRARLSEWLAYGHSAGHDFRVAINMSEALDNNLTPDDRTWLETQGIGLYITGAVVHQRNAPRDLALNIMLPNLSGAPRVLRELLSPSFEQVAGPDWREGFLSACEIFEDRARQNLLRGIQTGRIQLHTSRGPSNPTMRQVKRMTMGQLADAYARIQSQNHLDMQIRQGLARLNPDRVSATHRRRHAGTERRLRANVGRHLYTIFSVMRQLIL